MPVSPGGNATFFLLARNPDLVTNGRHYSLLPAGEFCTAGADALGRPRGVASRGMGLGTWRADRAWALTVLVALLLGLPGCARVAVPEPARGGEGEVAAFVQALRSRGPVFDYEPIKSPKDAVTKAGLVVTGTVVEVVFGLRVGKPGFIDGERDGHTYATLVIEVDKVISGSSQAAIVDRRVLVAVVTGVNVKASEIPPLPDDTRVVAVLGNSGLRSSRGQKVYWPSAIAEGSFVRQPYIDGLWLQGPDDASMTGVYVERVFSPSAWQNATTVEAYASRLSEAA